MIRLARSALVLPFTALLCSCAGSRLPPTETVPQVELSRFMGDWFVIACIPTFIEKNAYNAIESYRLAEDGTVATTFTFRDGSFEGELKRYTPRGFIVDKSSNAVWGMQFIWPIKAEYRISYLDPAYSQTVITRTARDYVWVMARTPSIPDADFARLVELIDKLGYATANLRKVPQYWPQTGYGPVIPKGSL